ncbi:hypothetical protein AWB78_02419 [Caballeronia calidae]|uniref:Lipase (Class 3) n=1 Tax=Caballeronia calidae TaxID=1777139 RepID=A0A158B9T8_9BURK|nr:hypothetical protein [Caballeronia calidae]SAK66546.1 hypothetical protein AWB78_02419 [Caballeronia calidae]
MSVTTPTKENSFAADCRRYLRNLKQTQEEVLVRAPGDRTFGEPEAAFDEAKKHWEFALLSQVAYAKAASIKKALRKKVSVSSAEFPREAAPEYAHHKFNPEVELARAGWTSCDAFVDNTLDKAFKSVHLRLEVWKKSDNSALAVAFGGTVATSWRDWQANLRWFLPKWPDEYSVLVTKFVPAFLDSISREFPQLPPVVYSTGHSLGGGLAQQFAYALPDKLLEEGKKLPRVIQVYAFDPSPVTGFYTLARALRTQNATGLKTDRVFERGEILAFFRSALALAVPPSKENPAVRAVRYNFMGHVWPVHSHNMSRLARSLYDATHPDSTFPR